MNKQRLSKVICFVALMFSVFLCSAGVVLADDTDSVDWGGYFNVYGLDYMLLSVAEQNNLPSSTAYSATFSGSSNVSVECYGFEQGYSYNGLAWFDFTWDRQYYDSTALYGRTNVFCTDLQVPSGVSVSFRTMLTDDPTSQPWLRVFVYFENYYHTPVENYLHFSFVSHIEQSVTTTSGGSLTPYYFVRNPLDKEWAGTVTATRVNADPNITDVYYVGEQQMQQQAQISQQEMQQQQQIANQQSQQSAQQHEDLKNGFQDDAYNSNVSNAGNTVDSYISVESDLMNSQNQIMSNYTDTAFNTGTIAPFTNAIAMCSTWYTWIWNSFGELNVAFVVVLAVGVACLIVGIKKRG